MVWFDALISIFSFVDLMTDSRLLFCFHLRFCSLNIDSALACYRQFQLVNVDF